MKDYLNIYIEVSFIVQNQYRIGTTGVQAYER